MKNDSRRDAEVYERLKELGLTEYEARIYFTLVARSPIAVNDISAEADVPMSKIYGVLSKLENGGWIGVVPERPKKYQATDPKVCVDLACSNAIDRLESTRRVLLDSLSELYEKRAADAVTPEFQVVHGTINILNHLKEILVQETGIVTVVIAFISLRTAGKVHEIIAGNTAEKRIIIINSKDELKAYGKLLGNMPGVTAIEADEKWIEGVLFVYTENRGIYCSVEGNEYRMALDIMDRGFLELIKMLFEMSHPEPDTVPGQPHHQAIVKGTIDRFLNMHK